MSDVSINKTCSCGIKYTKLPEVYDEMVGLYWFTCSCGSTCTVPTSAYELEMARLKHRHRNADATKMRREDNAHVLKSYQIKSKPPAPAEAPARGTHLRLVKPGEMHAKYVPYERNFGKLISQVSKKPSDK